VGDAGYFKDPITAHGLTDAFRDAELLARAVLEHGGDDLASYESARDDLSRELLETTDRIAAFAWTADALRVLHERLSDHMKAEVSALRALQPIAGVMA
jgi:flavin-dependent dehydrogenase